jgi:hypothetical protein
MLPENSLIHLYRTFYPSRELSSDDKFIHDFISAAEDNEIDALDHKIVDVYKNDPNFIEKRIIQYILNSKGIEPDFNYLSLYAQKLNAECLTDEKDKVVLVDELLQYTMISFYMTIYSLANDQTPLNFERCFKNLIVLLDLQGQKNIIGTHNFDNIIEMSLVPTNVMHLAMDTYWTSWTFVIGHELYHLQNRQNRTGVEDELNADAYGYEILLHMIIEQLNNKMDPELSIFYEYLYLAPIMLMEYYKLLIFYKKLISNVNISQKFLYPEKRQEHLFSLFDTLVPDIMDTTVGNDLLNSFLDVIELLREQLTIKKELGKLNKLIT